MWTSRSCPHGGDVRASAWASGSARFVTAQASRSVNGLQLVGGSRRSSRTFHASHRRSPRRRARRWPRRRAPPRHRSRSAPSGRRGPSRRGRSRRHLCRTRRPSSAGEHGALGAQHGRTGPGSLESTYDAHGGVTRSIGCDAMRGEREIGLTRSEQPAYAQPVRQMQSGASATRHTRARATYATSAWWKGRRPPTTTDDHRCACGGDGRDPPIRREMGQGRERN